MMSTGMKEANTWIMSVDVKNIKYFITCHENIKIIKWISVEVINSLGKSGNKWCVV